MNGTSDDTRLDPVATQKDYGQGKLRAAAERPSECRDQMFGKMFVSIS